MFTTDIPSATRSRTRRRVAIGAATVTAAAGLTGLGIAQAAPSSAATSCPTVDWGSLQKSSASTTTHPVTDIRAGRHACFDRMVVDLGRSGARTVGYKATYVSSVKAPGSGQKVPVRGGADIRLVINAPVHDRAGHLTYHPNNPRQLVKVKGYNTFRQVALAGSFEGRTTIALGVRARLPMRIFVLHDADGAQRLVVDVRHHW